MPIDIYAYIYIYIYIYITLGVSRRDRICELMFLTSCNNVFNHVVNSNFPNS